MTPAVARNLYLNASMLPPGATVNPTAGRRARSFTGGGGFRTLPAGRAAMLARRRQAPGSIITMRRAGPRRFVPPAPRIAMPYPEPGLGAMFEAHLEDQDQGLAGFSLGKIFKNLGKVVKKVAPIAAAGAAMYFGGPIAGRLLGKVMGGGAGKQAAAGIVDFGRSILTANSAPSLPGSVNMPQATYPGAQYSYNPYDPTSIYSASGYGAAPGMIPSGLPGVPGGYTGLNTSVPRADQALMAQYAGIDLPSQQAGMFGGMGGMTPMLIAGAVLLFVMMNRKR